MKQLDPQLRRLFDASKAVRHARVNAEARAPLGFATRVAACGQAAAESAGATSAWISLSRWGLGVSCVVLLGCGVLSRTHLNEEWSPAWAVMALVPEAVSMP